ncbi:MAG TPA: hypothetical protein VH440_12650 [Candidatus Limnocylindrales bacterium]|jgi:hypothetical protein
MTACDERALVLEPEPEAGRLPDRHLARAAEPSSGDAIGTG